MQSADSALWDDFVAAQRYVTECRRLVSQSGAVDEFLTRALDLRASAWDQRAAMDYLSSYPGEIPAFVPILFRYSMGGRWETRARRLLSFAKREDVTPEILRLAAEFLPKSDAEDYLQLAALLAAIETGKGLRQVVISAAGSEFPDVREAGDFIAERYGHIIGKDMP